MTTKPFPWTARSSSALTAASAVAISAGVGVAVGVLSPGARAILLGVIAAVLAVPLVRRAVAGRLDPLEPIFVAVLAYAVMFLVRPLSTIASGDFVYEIAGQGVGIDATFNRMLVAGAVGAAGLVAGYEAPLGARLAGRIRPPRDTRALLPATLAFAAAGVALFVAFVAMKGGALVFSGRSAQLTEAVSDSSKYLYFGPMLLIPAALTALAQGLDERRRTLLVLAGALALAVLVMRGPVGSRMTLLPLFGGAVTYVYLARGRRPSVPAVLAMLAVALTLSSVLLGVRDAAQREHTGLRGAIAQIAGDPVVVLNPLLQGQDAAEAAALASALTLIPAEQPHTYGRSVLADVVLRPVPRSHWPGKPRSPREQMIATLWPRLYATGAANPEFSALLVPYLDGGLPAIAIGMFGYGLLLRAGYAYLRRHATSTIVRLLYAVSLPMVVVLLRDSLTDTVARAAFLVVPLVVAYLAAARYR